MHSRVAFFQREAALSPFEDRPESGAFHGIVGRAFPAVFECGAGHLDTVLLFGQFGQFVVDHFPSALSLAREEASYLRE